MRINIFGLGYVGCVSAACLADNGNSITGIDIDETKVKMINAGKSPVIEPGLEDLIKKGIKSKNIRATASDIEKADISIVCVGTPGNGNGSLGLTSIKQVALQIGDYLRNYKPYHVINIRSTILPGTIRNVIIPTLERRSGKIAGKDFGVCMNPEFMREGTSIADYYNPPFTIIGELDKKSGTTITALYTGIKAPIIRTKIETAEIVKYACNSFHALKISFANEIGNICKCLGINGREAMQIFCRDNKLNISAYYLRPAFAFGGACLPKDLRALLYKANELGIDAPVLRSILRSNQNQVENAYRLIMKAGKKNVGIIGLSFKAGSDDLRESPIVDLIEKLIGKGYRVSIYDKEVSLAKLFGSNRRYIENVIPHISSLMNESLEDVFKKSEVIVIAKPVDDIDKLKLESTRDHMILDLIGLESTVAQRNGRYEGICW
jgi:GDP-mannose 6-dehydrogenase